MSETQWKKTKSRLFHHCLKRRKISASSQFLLLLIFCLTISRFKVDGSSQEYAISIHALEKLALADLSVVMDILEFKEECKAVKRGQNRLGNSGNDTDQDFLAHQIEGYLQDFTASTGIKIRGGKTINGHETGSATGDGNFTLAATKGWSANWIKKMAGKLSENPISAHRLIRRTALVLPSIVEKASKQLVFSSELVKERQFPDDKDIETAVDGIIRLSEHYDFPASQLADGVFGGVKTGIKMNALQCFEIGLRSRDLGRHLPSLEWLKLALKKTIGARHDFDFDRSLSEENTAWIQKELEMTKNEGNLDTFAGAGAARQRSWIAELGISTEQSTILPLIERRRILFPTDSARYFPKICAGDNYQIEEDKSRLFCWLEFSAHPLYRIGPLKIEFLSREPDIVQIYDFLGEEAIEWLKNEAVNPQKSKDYPTLEDAKDGYSVQKEVARVHTVIGEEDPPEVQKLHRRISAATGLKIIKRMTAENLTVGSYNFAGHYQPHTDTIAGGAHNPLPRIASFLIYLSNTESGGFTAFCSVGVGARPIKGSAIFWYNLQRDGKLDIKTIHGACPPILSRKIIAQLWIRPYQNFDPSTFSRFSKRSEQQQQQQQRLRFRFKVNGKISQVKT